MNCAQTRRAALIDPHRLSPDARAHIESCHACRELLDRQKLQQSLIAAVVADTRRPAMSATAPAALPVAAATNASPLRTRRHFIMTAAGAAFATAALGVGLWRRGLAPSYDESHWAHVVVQHFQEDPLHLLPPDPQAADQAQALLNRLGAQTLASLPTVIRVNACTLLDCEAAHVVLEWRAQRVVAFLVPHKARRVTALEADGWHGELRPMVGGMVATLAREREVAESIAVALASALAWRA